MNKTYFTKDFIKFFQELEHNNNKDWFDVNRSRYHSEIKKPFEIFIGDLINNINTEFGIEMAPVKHSIFRINRDIRFSKDKAPYKTTRSAIISKYGTKHKSFPGFYLEVNLSEIRFYGGVYRLKSPEIKSVREELLDYPEEYLKIINAPDFKKVYGEVHGETAKRISKDHARVAEQVPDVYNKNWYVFNKVPLKLLNSEKLMEETLKHYRIVKPFIDYFERPLNFVNDV